MSQEDGQYEYEPEALEWLEARSVEYFVTLHSQAEDQEGPVYRDTILIMTMTFHINHDDAIARIQAWVEWCQYNWLIQCENCGSGLDIGHFTSSHSCACGSTYIIDGWREYHRDDTLGGRITTEVGEFGTTMKTFHL